MLIVVIFFYKFPFIYYAPHLHASASVAYSSFHYFVLHVRLGNREHDFGTVTQESRLKLFIQEDHVISKICYCQAKHLLNSCYTSQFSS